MAKIITTIGEQVAIVDRLREALIKNADGSCTYPPGMSDDAIAKAVNDRLGAGHVRRIRTELFGSLRAADPKTPASADMTIAEIRDILDDIRTLIGRVDKAVNTMDMQISGMANAIGNMAVRITAINDDIAAVTRPATAVP